MQNFAGRIVSGTRKFDQVTPVLKQLNWLPVRLVMLPYKDVALAFKCVKGLAPRYLSDRCITCSKVHSRNSRYKDMLNIPAFKSAAGQRTFLYRTVSLWNSLPSNLKDSISIDHFKRDYKMYLLEQF